MYEDIYLVTGNSKKYLKLDFPLINLHDSSYYISGIYLNQCNDDKEEFQYVRKLIHNVILDHKYNYEKKKPCFIICSARSGSNLLTRAIAHNKDIFDYGEIFLDIMAMRPPFGKEKEFIHCLIHGSKSICPLFRVHLHYLNQRGLLPSFCTENASQKHILLFRRDLLAQFISLKIADKTKEFFIEEKKEEETHEPIKIDYKEYVQYVYQMNNFYSQITSSFNKMYEYLIVEYEELAENPTQLIEDSVLPFLELNNATVEIKTYKQNTNKLQDIVINFTELEQAVSSDKRYIKIFDDLPKQKSVSKFYKLPQTNS